MAGDALTFEWDPRKAALNFAKHGVSFQEATGAFADPLGCIISDPRHSIGEERLVLIGMLETGQLIAVMFTERGQNRVRLIGARRATRREREDYEEAKY